MATQDHAPAGDTIQTPLGTRTIHRLTALSDIGDIGRLPVSIKVLLEAALRHFDGFVITDETVRAIASYDAADIGQAEIPFIPGRVVLQDFTGVPAVVDLAAMRSAMQRLSLIHI